MGLIFRSHDLVSQSSRQTGKVITSAGLDDLLKQWSPQGRHSTARPSHAHARGCIEFAASTSAVFEDSSVGDIAPIPTISLSVRLLIITLRALLASHGYTTTDHDPRSIPLVSGTSKPTPPAQLLMTRMADNGWCPFHIYQLCRSQNYAVTYFVSQLQHPASDGVNHTACSETQSVGKNIKDNYESKHKRDGCGCSMVSIPVNEIIEILRQGGIPLVSIHESPYHGRLEVRVRKLPHRVGILLFPTYGPMVRITHFKSSESWQETC